MVLPDDANIKPRRYPTAQLGEDFLKINPTEHFRNWYDDALEKEATEPDAFTLSTYDGKKVNARTVALRGFESGNENRGIFYIYTNYNSAKSKEIESYPNVALTFYWPNVFRQVRITGIAKRCTENQSDEYFATRPRGSQVGSWTSRQDEYLSSRNELLSEFKKYEQEFGDKVERPPFWGGFEIQAIEYEFMQGFENRLHDRFKYVFDEKLNQFYGKRLWP